MENLIINGQFAEVTEIYGNIIVTSKGEYVIFDDRKEAGEAARDYWVDMAQNDPTEFTHIVGEEALIAWALGQNYAPGSIGVDSLDEWLDLYLDVPEEHHAAYDGEEVEVFNMNRNLQNELDITLPCVAYRSN